MSDHGTMRLSRQQRRRAKVLAEKVDAVIEGDRRFFDRHGGRSYRVRRGSQIEIEAARNLGALTGDAPGFSWFVAVRQFAPGVRARIFFGARTDNECDIPEWECRWLYDREVALQPTALFVNRKLEEIGDAVRERRAGTGGSA